VQHLVNKNHSTPYASRTPPPLLQGCSGKESFGKVADIEFKLILRTRFISGHAGHIPNGVRL